MKKTFMIILAVVMTFATITTAVSFASADETEESVTFIEATLNEVTLDGEITATTGTKITYGEDKKTVVDMGEASTAEYRMTTTAGEVLLGAAWSQTEKELYIAIKGESLVAAEIEIGGQTYDVDLVNGAVEGGEAFVNPNGDVAEIALPIEGLELKHNGRYVWTDLAITVSASDDYTFEGGFAFLPYTLNMVVDSVNKNTVDHLIASDAGNSLENGFFTMADHTPAPDANVRKYCIFANQPAVASTKNMIWEMDLNVVSMPNATLPQQGGPAKAIGNESGDGHIWLHVKHDVTDTLYFSLYNTADEGLVLMNFKSEGFMPEMKATKIVLGKQTGETFKLSIEWNEEDVLNVYVDGVLLATVENAMNTEGSLGANIGGLWLNTDHKTPFDIGVDKMEIKYGNVSLTTKVEAYDEQALIDLSSVPVEVPTEEVTTQATETTQTPAGDDETESQPAGDDETESTPAGTESEPAEETTTKVADTTKAPAATTKAADTTAAEDEGCGSSLVGYGAFMVIGTALMAVVGTSKKKED